MQEALTVEQIVLKGKIRAGNGTADARRMRLEGYATGNLYGHGEGNVSFLVEQIKLNKLVHEGHHLLQLDLDGKKDVGLMKELQFDLYGDRITHVDFLRVSMDEVIESNVEVRTLGVAKGVGQGGTMDIVHHGVALRGKARDLPEHLDLDVEALALGDAIRAGDLELPAGVECLLDAEEAIIIIHAPRTERESASEDEATEGDEPAPAAE